MGVKVQVKSKNNFPEIAKRLLEIARAGHVKVGVLDAGPGGVSYPSGGLTVAEIAALQEFGSSDGHTPERSFMRSTLEAKRDKLREMSVDLIDKILAGEMDVERAKGILGAYLAAEMKKTITTGEGVPPPNAPSTVAEKGSSRPLVDSSRMVNAITWADEKSGESAGGEGGEEK